MNLFTKTRHESFFLYFKDLYFVYTIFYISFLSDQY